MPIKWFTVEQHQQVVENLVALARSVDGMRYHSAGPEYTSLMVCFLLHNLSVAKALLSLRDSFGNEWFPCTAGYVIVRSMFETEVTAHYISKSPRDRSRRYIDFGHILSKREMDICRKHRESRSPQWREVMNLMWDNVWASKENEIHSKYSAVRSTFETVTKKGGKRELHNWSGKTFRQMAVEVDHEEAYDVFYAELSSFTHVDVRLADRFLRIHPNGLSWSLRSSESDVGNVFRYAASFLTCFLELLAEQFSVWKKEDVRKCWDVEAS